MPNTEHDVSGKPKRFIRVTETLRLNTETGFYYVRKSFKRDRIPELFATTKETTKGAALRHVDKMIEDHRKKYLSGAVVTGRHAATVGDIVEQLLAGHTPTKRKSTQAQHRIYLNELRREIGRYPIESVTLEMWVRWLEGFKRRKSRETFFDYGKAINIILNYAYKTRQSTHLVTIPNPDALRVTQFRVYTDKEITALYGAMDEEMRTQFVLSYECMMRLREMLRLTWDRVDLKTGIITLRAEDVKTGTKTGKGRAFVMSPSALERLGARKRRGPWVFPSPKGKGPIDRNQTAWRTAKRKSGIDNPKQARWHDLRHTAITKALLVAEAPIVKVSEYAGVSVRTIQRVYLHSTAEQTASVSHAVKVRKA